MSVRVARLVGLVALAGCATLASPGAGDSDLPHAGVGPFRKLKSGEVPGLAPLVLDARAPAFREPAAMPLGGDGVALYLVASRPGPSGPRDVIVRTRADDGRAFHGAAQDLGRQPIEVLAADRAWEGGALAGPSAVHDGERVLLYYAAGGAIGVAHSRDGLTFEKEAEPVLRPGGGGRWEGDALRAPTVERLPDGRWRMLYASGLTIGEAESDDGLRWRRLDAEPSTPELDPALPTSVDRLDDPCLDSRITSAGRLHTRVFYTWYTGSAEGAPSTIGLAARFGDQGAFERAERPVFGGAARERAPAVHQLRGDRVLLYVQEDFLGAGDATPSLAIAAALSPANAELSEPLPFPATP